jgi:hypothetical protein
MGSIANISGVALVPGVSRNRRLYTPEAIAKAAARMQQRLADPNGLPIVMRTHHGADDDSSRIVGRVTGVSVGNDKSLRYTAELHGTRHGQDIAALVKPAKGKPALRSVSIHGYWMSEPQQVTAEGGMVQTADDLEIDAIDFTASPGVDGALIDSGGTPTENHNGRFPISESMEATFTLVEEGTGQRAARDSGGAMKETTPVRMSEVREYWPDGPENPSGFCIDAYSGPLSVTVRGSVSPDELRAAATMAMCAAMDAISCMDPDVDADIDVSTEDMGDADNMDGLYGESSNGSEEMLTEEAVREMIAQQFAEMRAPFEKLAEDITAKLQAAEETTPAAPAEEAAPQTSPPNTAETNNEEELAMSETTQAAEAAPNRTLTEADMTALGTTIGNALADALRAVAEMNTPKHAATQETTETVAEVTAETAPPKADIDIAALKESLAQELRKEIRNDLRAELLEEKGLPQRRGYRLTENDEPKELTNAELFDQHRVDILLGAYAAVPVADAPAA